MVNRSPALTGVLVVVIALTFTGLYLGNYYFVRPRANAIDRMAWDWEVANGKLPWWRPAYEIFEWIEIQTKAHPLGPWERE